MNKSKLSFFKRHEKIIVISIVGFAFLLFNLYMPTNRSDDINYLTRVNSMGYIGASIEHYKNWSSRIIIEVFLMFFSKHFLLWKFANTFMMLITLLLLCKYTFKKISIKNFLMLFSIYCMIPLTVMGESGWRATTLNYQWPLTFSLIAFYPFYQLLNKQKIDIKIYYLCIPLLIFGANQEQVNICYFVLTALLSFYLILNNCYNIKLLPLSVISFIELVFSLTTPGNSVRSVQEVSRWFPQYENFSLVNKIDLGISSFGKPFFLDINIIFLFLFFLVSIIVYFKIQNYYLRLVSSLPLFFNLIIYFGNTMKQGFLNVSGNFRAMIWSSNNVDKVFTKMGTKLSFLYPGTWIATLLIIGLLICLLVGIYLAFDNKKKAIFSCLLLLMGAFSRIIMGFSPTVWASGMRTYYILFVVSTIIILLLFEEWIKILAPKKMESIQFSMTLLGICTFILTILNK